MVSQIRVDGGQVQPVIKRQQNVGDDEIAYEEAETGLHIGHVDAAYHTRDGNEGNSRKGGSDHSERNNIPGRTAVAAEERVIIGMTAGKAGYKQQYSEIEQYVSLFQMPSIWQNRARSMTSYPFASAYAKSSAKVSGICS